MARLKQYIVGWAIFNISIAAMGSLFGLVALFDATAPNPYAACVLFTAASIGLVEGLINLFQAVRIKEEN